MKEEIPMPGDIGNPSYFKICTCGGIPLHGHIYNSDGSVLCSCITSKQEGLIGVENLIKAGKISLYSAAIIERQINQSALPIIPCYASQN